MKLATASLIFGTMAIMFLAGLWIGLQQSGKVCLDTLNKACKENIPICLQN